MVATAALREALTKGISSGNLVDTKIILYSYRDPSGCVCRPKALYTNSHILKTVPYFNDLLFGNFAESHSKDFEEAIDEDEFAEGYGYLSDSDLEDDEDKNVFSLRQPAKSEAPPSDPFAIPGEDTFGCEIRDESVKRGKVVKIPDIALVTFQAFLMYLYTDAIDFAPFGSDENRRSRSAEIASPPDDKVPRPSPKSIYRLADKYDIPALKTLALSCIRSGLAKCDIVEESFSRFASQYDEARKLYTEQLASAWMEDSTAETIRANVGKKIDSFVEGDLEHAAELISALWEIADKEGDVKPASNPEPAATQATNPAHWKYVNMGLVKSIRTGIFFDRKYWVKHSTFGDALKPIYFSSVIMSDKARHLNKLVKYMKGRNPSMSDLGDANVESDYEPIGPVINHTPQIRVNTSPFFGGRDSKPPSPALPPAYPTPAKSPWFSSLLDSPGPAIASPSTPLSGPGPATPSIELAIPNPDFESVPAPVNPRGKKKKKPQNIPINARLSTLVPAPVEEESKPVASPPEPAGEDRPGSWGTNWGLVKPPEPKKPDSPFRKLARAGGSMGVADELWGTEENGDEEQARAVLLTGSFSAWRSLFFYRCTDEVSFAPLKSQGVDQRSNYIREKTVPTAPPPCSPKSIYLLASLLEIQPLRDTAFADIKAKVSQNNVVDEAFSWITADQKDLLEMECDLLVSSPKGSKSLALVKQNIRRISDGSSPYCGGALKLGLEKKFQRKKESLGVKLRCTHGSCTWYSNPVSLSTIGTNAYYCQMCLNRGWGSRYFTCVGCGYTRNGSFVACQGCGKNFL